jgi:hypothetical protein
MGRAKLDELLQALEYVSTVPDMGNEAFLSRETGAVYWRSEDGDNFDEVPTDVDEPDKYLSIPHKADLGLGKPLALRFAEELMAHDIGRVREIFSRRGAYARFKDLLSNRGMLERWHGFEAAAHKRALVQWCEENGVEIDG